MEKGRTYTGQCRRNLVIDGTFVRVIWVPWHVNGRIQLSDGKYVDIEWHGTDVQCLVLLRASKEPKDGILWPRKMAKANTAYGRVS